VALGSFFLYQVYVPSAAFAGGFLRGNSSIAMIGFAFVLLGIASAVLGVFYWRRYRSHF
jgi:hypothetical protein